MRIVIGRIGKPHGTRGEVTVEPRTDEPELRFAPDAVLLTETAPVQIETVRFHHNTPLIKFVGVESRESAELLRNTMLHIESDDDIAPNDEDEFWDHELMRMQVYAPDGTALGTIADVLHLPGQDVLVVSTPDEREVLLPFVRTIVTEISRETSRVTVADPGGLFDDGEAEIAADEV